MGWKSRLGQKFKAGAMAAGKGALRLGKKVATGALYAGVAVLGAKAAWDHYGDDIKQSLKDEVNRSIVDPAKQELTAQGEALATNIQNIAQEGQAGVQAAVSAAINPLKPSPRDAFQQAGGEAAQHQAELVGALGNKPAAQAVQDRYNQAHALPDENAPTGTMAEQGRTPEGFGSGGKDPKAPKKPRGGRLNPRNW